MEKVDIVALALLINVIIFGCYIIYLKIGIKFILDELAKHHVCLENLSKAMEDQVNINKKQVEINKELSKALSSSPTGGQKQSN